VGLGGLFDCCIKDMYEQYTKLIGIPPLTQAFSSFCSMTIFARYRSCFQISSLSLSLRLCSGIYDHCLMLVCCPRRREVIQHFNNVVVLGSSFHCVFSIRIDLGVNSLGEIWLSFGCHFCSCCAASV
jgi:hypothetical protein